MFYVGKGISKELLAVTGWCFHATKFCDLSDNELIAWMVQEELIFYKVAQGMYFLMDINALNINVSSLSELKKLTELSH